jgi:hypothetical protein
LTVFQKQLLENESVNVARFKYGINDAIPHSRSGELLCPDNVIDEGIVRLLPISSSADVFTGHVGYRNLPPNLERRQKHILKYN